MNTESTVKKKSVFHLLPWAVSAALIITAIVQAGHIRKLNRELDNLTLSERNLKDVPSKSKTLSPSSGIPTTSENGVSDKEKIIKLESQIADMQAWQDYLEGSLQKEKNIDADQIELARNAMSSMLSSQLDPFVEEVGLSQDIKTKLYDMLVERNYEFRDEYNDEIKHEDRQKEIEYINQKYDELISELLADKYLAYREYTKVQSERYYIENFKNSMMLGDNWLGKQQEKNLIAALYNDNQIINGLYKEKMSNDTLSESDRIRENFELQKMLYNRYIDSGKDILSESQLKKFQKYIDVEIANLEMRTNSMLSQSVNHKEWEDDQ